VAEKSKIAVSAQRKRITDGGQVSIPAAARSRWGTRDVLIEDLGDEVRIRPVSPDEDVVARLFGLYPDLRPSDEARGAARSDEAAASRRHGG
jgi:bifunctional DNA-binding transcriptional regulator/antitoxin component of YhaV-PrlF toxin-antitoxin module